MSELIELEEAPPKAAHQRPQGSSQERNLQPDRDDEVEEGFVLGGLVNQIDEDDWLI